MDLPKVIIYTKANCVQCESTKRSLAKAEVPFEIVDLEHDPETLKAFIEAGHLTAPVVTFGDKTWSGYRHGEIQNLIQHFKAVRAAQ